MVNSFQKVRVETDLLPDYILDYSLDNDTPNGDNGINDNDDCECYNNDNNGNNDLNHHNDHNDDNNDNNHDKDNGDHTIIILENLSFVKKLNFVKVHRS